MKTVTLPPSLLSSDPDYTRERYDVDQAALYLGRSADFVYRLVEKNEIGYRRDRSKKRSEARVRRTSGRLSFSQADLDAYRARCRSEAISNVKPAATSMAVNGSSPAAVLPMPAERRLWHGR